MIQQLMQVKCISPDLFKQAYVFMTCLLFLILKKLSSLQDAFIAEFNLFIIGGLVWKYGLVIVLL